MAAAPSIFDVFNARNLTPQQVARSFVPPPHFSNLTKATHTLIVGPRGSGKTTLLKMLHPGALGAWNHPEAKTFQSAIDYTGVFIATDINWNEQVKSLGDGRLDVDSHRQFAKAAFTSEILLSLIESMSYRLGRVGPPAAITHRPVAISHDAEGEIANELIAAWQLGKTIRTLEGIQLALLRRLSDIRVLASQEASRAVEGRGERIADISFLHLDFLSAAAVAIDVFNTKAREPGRRWALLFDEIELAPDWIRAMLIRNLRSVDQRFLFKISLSPYSVDLKKEMDQPHGAGARQDFEPIRLWYVNKEHGYPFCRELLKGVLKERGMDPIEPEELFGTSAFSTGREEWESTQTAYSLNSVLGKQFASLRKRDPTFDDYLNRRGIELSTMHTIKGTQRAADLRKTRSIVALRDYFRGGEVADDSKSQGSKAQSKRSRKIPTVYAGATSLFAMMEGNPRWFIGIVGELLKQTKAGTVAKPVQVRHVLDAADVFRAMLKTIPCGPVGASKRGLLSLLDPIGDYFSRSALYDAFDADPPCSFIVDRDTATEELNALGMALNAGAIVYAPDEGDVGVLESLKGKRFRLSYILAPHYKIPLVLGRSVSLRTAVEGPSKTMAREPSLFSRLEQSDE